MNASLPACFRIRQHFPDNSLSDVVAAIRAEIDRSSLSRRIRPGDSVAIAVGSRGIDQVPGIVRTVATAVRALGGEPWIVPAMGSHGGAMAEGQAAVLADYGVSPTGVGCEVRASMQVCELGHTSTGVPVYFDALAAAADHVIVVNRIKPHTQISGPYESGLAKMMLIGLGKHRGAAAYHQAMVHQRFEDLVRQVVPLILQQVPISLGIAILENAHDRVAQVAAVEPEDLLKREPQLLQMARQMMPRLPFDTADLLIVDQIGKNISGSGLDTNVVGRKFHDKLAGEHEWPKISQIYVRSLTPQSAGNAAGIGIAEYCRSDLVRRMDVEKTRINCLTALHITSAAIPIHWETDREVLLAAATQAGRSSPRDLRWMWIRDTLHVAELMCSEAYLSEADGREDLSIIAPVAPLRLDASGQLLDLFEQ